MGNVLGRQYVSSSQQRSGCYGGRTKKISDSSGSRKQEIYLHSIRLLKILQMDKKHSLIHLQMQIFRKHQRDLRANFDITKAPNTFECSDHRVYLNSESMNFRISYFDKFRHFIDIAVTHHSVVVVVEYYIFHFHFTFCYDLLISTE